MVRPSLHLAAGQARQLEHDVLDDVAEVGAAVQRIDEAACTAGRAVMGAQAGQREREALGKAGEFRRLAAGELVQLEPREADRRSREDIRAAETTHVFQMHSFSFTSHGFVLRCSVYQCRLSVPRVGGADGGGAAGDVE